MTQVYTYPERKEIFADSIEDLEAKAEELKEEFFVPMTKISKTEGTYRQTFIKQAETDQAEFPYVVNEEETTQEEPENP